MNGRYIFRSHKTFVKPSDTQNLCRNPKPRSVPTKSNAKPHHTPKQPNRNPKPDTRKPIVHSLRNSWSRTCTVVAQQSEYFALIHDLNPDHRKDLKRRSPNLGPYTTKGCFKGTPLEDLFFRSFRWSGKRKHETATAMVTTCMR